MKLLKIFFVVCGLLYTSTTFVSGYIGIYNTTGEDFVIGKVKIGCFNVEKLELNELYGINSRKHIEDTEYLNEIVPAKGFFVISYGCNYKDGEEMILFELLSKDEKKGCSINLFFSEEKIIYHGSYKITHRFAGMGDCSIIPDCFLSHLCDRLIIISERTSAERSSNCNIF